MILGWRRREAAVQRVIARKRHLHKEIIVQNLEKEEEPLVKNKNFKKKKKRERVQWCPFNCGPPLLS